MSFTFLKAKGMEIGNSLLEADQVEVAKDILSQGGEKITLPVDCLVSDWFDAKARKAGTLKTVDTDAIPEGWTGLDIGPKTVSLFGSLVGKARTVVWNGPMGVFEMEEAATGTYAIAKLLPELTARGATTVIGGGDSAAAVEKAGVAAQVSHVSTGGGATLEFMEGKTLPGVAALDDKEDPPGDLLGEEALSGIY